MYYPTHAEDPRVRAEPALQCEIRLDIDSPPSDDCDGTATHACASCGDACCECCSVSARDTRRWDRRRCDRCECNRMMYQEPIRTLRGARWHIMGEFDEQAERTLRQLIHDFEVGWSEERVA